MSNPNAFTAINMFEAITAPLQGLSDKLDRFAKACSVATSGFTAVANATAALQNGLNFGTVGAATGMGKATSAMEVPSVGQNGLEQVSEVANTAASSFDKLTESIVNLKSTAGDLSKGAFDPLWGNLDNIVHKTIKWCESNPKLTGSIFASAAGVKALAAGAWGAVHAIGQMGNTVSSSIKGFDEWPKNMERIKGALKGFWPFKGKASPIGGISETINPGAMRSPISPYSAFSYKASPALLTRGFGPSTGGIGPPPIFKAITSPVIPPVTSGGGALKGAGALLAPLKTAGSGMAGVFKGVAAAVMVPLKAVGAAIAGIGWPVLATIAAIAGAAFLIYKYWEPIKGFLAKVWDSFMGAGPVVDALLMIFMPWLGLPLLIVKHWDTIKAFFNGVWGAIKEGWEQWGEPAFEGLKEAGMSIWNVFSSLLDVFSPLREGQEGVNGAFEKGVAVGEGIAWVFGIIMWVAQKVAQGIEAIVIVVVTLVDLIVTAAKTIWNAITGIFTGNFSGIGEAWSGFSDRFWSRLDNSSMNPDKDKNPVIPATPQAENKAAKAMATASEPAKKGGILAQMPAMPNIFGEAGAVEDVKNPHNMAAALRQNESPAALAKQGYQGNDPGHSLIASQCQQKQVNHTTTINYNPHITLTGAATAEDEGCLMKLLRKHQEELTDMINGVNIKRKAWAPT